MADGATHECMCSDRAGLSVSGGISGVPDHWPSAGGFLVIVGGILASTTLDSVAAINVFPEE
jgi:hypothetical protein